MMRMIQMRMIQMRMMQMRMIQMRMIQMRMMLIIISSMYTNTYNRTHYLSPCDSPWRGYLDKG